MQLRTLGRTGVEVSPTSTRRSGRWRTSSARGRCAPSAARRFRPLGSSRPSGSRSAAAASPRRPRAARRAPCRQRAAA